MTTALALETQLTNSTSGSPIRVHDLLFTHIVSDEVEAGANHFDCLDLDLIGLLGVRKVEFLD